MENNILQDVVVSVSMITYNQKDYIRQAIDGVLMQKTDFTIELILSDDCSTDSTSDICYEYYCKYPNIIRLVSPSENLGSIRNFLRNLEFCRGKYIALCEGDDYWTDPLKLQKQVDFLESHTDYSMCLHSVWKLENGNTTHFVNIAKSEISVWDIINNWLVPTCSVLYRKISLDWVLCNKIGGFCGDFNIFINLSQHGRIHYISDMMGVYRIHSQGVTMTHLNSIKSQKAMLNQINRMSFYYPKIRKDLIYQYVSASVSYASCAIKRGNFTLFIYFLYKAFTKDLIKTNINIFSRIKQKFVRK